AVIAVPLFMEAAFGTANLLKLLHGGWLPLMAALIMFTLMSTWKRGRALLWRRVSKGSLPVNNFLDSLGKREIARVPGTAVCLAGNSDGTPLALLHNLKHNKVLHARVVFLTIVVEE